MDFSTKLTQSQDLVLSQKMIQSMEILQMSTTELAEYLEKASQENPVIDLDEQDTSRDFDRREDIQRKLEWLESTDRQNKVYYQNDREEIDHMQSAHDIKDNGETLQDYLESQILLKKMDPVDEKIVHYIIDTLDSKGYFTDSVRDAAEFLHVSEEQFLNGLKLVQTLDPAGIGARNLQECLLLQLKHRNEESSLTADIIRNHLDDVARHHVQILAKKLRVSPSEIEDSIQILLKLNPKPGNAYNNRENLNYISPDAVVVNTEIGFEILINEYQYPRFHINPYYRNMEKTTSDREAKKYLHQKIQEANQITDAVTMRTSTLSKVMHILVEKQFDFFMHGPGHKSPMTLADIANAADLHPSTISRTLRSKYLQCTWGVYPLSYFLTASVTGSNEDAITPDTLKAKIKTIIDAEDKTHPLSDEAIRVKLAEQDISLARRTVNKYRKELNIPDRSGRRIVES